MFEVKVVGEYIARSPHSETEKITKNYEVKGKVPTTNALLSVVKNKLLGPALAKKYPDFVTFRTYNVVEITPLDDRSREEFRTTEICFMDRDTLLRYIRDNALPVDARYFPNLFRLREAVQMAKSEYDETGKFDGYLGWFSRREADLRLDLEMQACNPDLFGQQPGDVPLAASVGTRNIVLPKALPKEKHAINQEDRLGGLTSELIKSGEMAPMEAQPAGRPSVDLNDL